MNRCLALAALAIITATPAFAHLGYGGRDFGSFLSSAEKSLTLSVTNISGSHGWADATDEDFGDSHHTRIFKFVLADPMLVHITVQSGGALLPAFSLYSGLASTVAPDHDFAPITQSYLASLGTKEGALNALATFKIGNDEGTSFDDLTTFTYLAHAADGTAANYGAAPGIFGDGLADGFVTASFNLPAGSYSFFVGGALYSGQSPTPDTTNYAASVTVSNIPEPATAMTLTAGLAALCGIRRRR